MKSAHQAFLPRVISRKWVLTTIVLGMCVGLQLPNSAFGRQNKGANPAQPASGNKKQDPKKRQAADPPTFTPV